MELSTQKSESNAEVGAERIGKETAARSEESEEGSAQWHCGGAD